MWRLFKRARSGPQKAPNPHQQTRGLRDRWQLPARPHRPAHEEPFGQRAALYCTQTGAADPAERAIRIAEQAIESVDHAERDQVLALAPALITSQHAQLGERFDVAAGCQL